MSLVNLKSFTVVPDAVAGTITVHSVFGAGTVKLPGPMSFNPTALLKLITDVATDLPVLIADFTAAFALKYGQLPGGLKDLHIVPDNVAGTIAITAVFITPAVDLLQSLATLNIAAIIKLITDIAADLPVLIADVEAVFAATQPPVVPPVPPIA